MLHEDLLWERNPAKVMNKEYDNCCPVCLGPDYPEWPVVHCGYCHEDFADIKWAEQHRYRGGCRFPGNLEGFYETRMYPEGSIWSWKDPNEKRVTRRVVGGTKEV